MKTIVFLTLLGIAFTAPQSGTDVDGRGLIDKAINKTINGILENLTDPITIDALPIDFGDSELLSGNLNASNININGIKTLVATQIAVDTSLNLDMGIHISEILVNFKYFADMVLAELVPLYGEGRINVFVENIDLSIAGQVEITNGIDITNLVLGISLGDATFDLNGLINNPEFSALVSTALNDNFVTFVDKNSDVISSILSPLVQKILGYILNGDTAEVEQLLLQLKEN